MTMLLRKEDLIKISDNIFEIPKTFDPNMRVPARIFINEHMVDSVLQDNSLKQIVNVTQLPGIQKFACVMPDVHEGYGFPIGGVAAMAIDEGGVISPGGIGYDINCGVRLLASNLSIDDVKDKIDVIANQIYRTVPSGTGRGGKIEISSKQLDLILEHGAKEVVKKLGMGNEEDLLHSEENGCFLGASAKEVSQKAKNRGIDQLGTLGSGNHFLELQVVEEIFLPDVANAFGLKKDQVTIMIHCGSRGLGHQVCSDYVSLMIKKQDKFSFFPSDRQLACAPFYDSLGQSYFKAMKAAANFAFANRHVIGHLVRQVFELYYKKSFIKTVYDVCHNVGKLETHMIDGVLKKLLVHRKGATRSFGPNNPNIPKNYRGIGQPVLIPGTMGTASYVLVGSDEGLKNSFGSSCHGAGRTMSRMKAKKTIDYNRLRKELAEKNIVVKSAGAKGLLEEAPIAYKEIEEVVDVVNGAGLARSVARLKPLAVIKGD